MNRRHGHARRGRWSPTYNTWVSVVQRTTNFANPNFLIGYGALGIDARWLGRGGFERFLADMGERPEGLTLDRKDGRFGYSKENCRWATPRVQAANRNTGATVCTHPETGETKTAYEWARGAGITDRAMRMRIAVGEAKGWPLERALTEKRTKAKARWRSRTLT